MATTETMAEAPATRSQQGVLCAKCEHMNPPGSNVCGECGSHLQVVCHYCGQRNRRVDPRCGKCGHHLHRSRWQRWRKKLMPRVTQFTVLQFVLMVIVVLIVYQIIIRIAGYSDRVP